MVSYIIAGSFLFIAIKRVIIFFKKKQWVIQDYYHHTTNYLKEKTLKRQQKYKQQAKFVLFVILSFNLFLYVTYKVEWMGDNNANLNAKQYWVAGQVVYSYRDLYTKLIGHPDDNIIRPFTWLQEWIYQQGSQYLPKDDGEIGVWADIWFIHPYSQRLLYTKGVSGHRVSPLMMALVERSWFSLQKMATGKYADKQIMEHYYYRNFPSRAFYYLKNKGFLMGRYQDSAKKYRQNDKLLNRDRQLIAWLDELQDKWQVSPKTLTFIQQHPKVEALLQLTQQMLAGDLMFGSVFKRKFSCDTPEVEQYLNYRLAFIGDEHTKSAFQRMQSQEQAKRLYGIAVKTYTSRMSSYILARFCNIKTAGEDVIDDAHFTYKPSRRTPKERLEESLKSIFREEINILEEMYHDN
ncbi:MAG: hypothetical protein GY928_22550 [Colwellia sp.]|nr:hypothetical protein [Colwellia sp.]